MYCLEPLENWTLCPAGNSSATFGFICNCNKFSKCPFPTEWGNFKKNMIKKWSEWPMTLLQSGPQEKMALIWLYMYLQMHVRPLPPLQAPQWAGRCGSWPHLRRSCILGQVLEGTTSEVHLVCSCIFPFFATKWVMTLMFVFIKWVGVILAILLLGSLNGTTLTINKEELFCSAAIEWNREFR